MDSEACEAGTLTLGAAQTNGDATLDDLVPHRMIVANGDVEDGVILAPDNGPKVLEMNCEAENNTENTKDLQKYASRLQENTTIEEDGALIREKLYEESAIRARNEKTDNAEVSSKSQIDFEEVEKVRQTEEGPAVAEYSARSEEKHHTSVTTTEPVGDSFVTRTRSSQKNVSKTCKRIEEVEADFPAGGAVTDSSARQEHAQSASLDRNEVDNTIIKRMEKTHRSEKCETKIVGSGGDVTILDKYESILSDSNRDGASIDLGALGEIRLSTHISSEENSLDRDFSPGITFSKHNSTEKQSSLGMASHEGSLVSRESDKGLYSSEATHAHSRAGSNISSSYLVDADSSYSNLRSYKMAKENGETDMDVQPGDRTSEKHPPIYRRNDRKSADDLVKRILAESKMEKTGGISRHKIKVDMGGATEEGDISSTSFSSLPLTLNSTGEGRESAESHNSMSYQKSYQEENTVSATAASFAESSGFSERAVGAERRRTASEGDEEGEEERSSLLQRRLGGENRLDTLFSGTESSTSSSAGVMYATEDFQQSKYSKKTTAADRDNYGEFQYQQNARYTKKAAEKDDFDELDEEINAMRSTYKDINTKRYQTLYGPDEEEDEEVPQYKPRGRMMRQGYVDDHYGLPPEEEEVLPDEYFMPSKRDETDQVVKERTAGIRTVVDKQSTVLTKLREASESFDELQNEIRSIKQQFIENQARRTYIMDNDEEIEFPEEPPRRGRYQRSQSYEYGSGTGGYTPYSGRSAGLDSELNSETVYAGSSLGMASSYKPYVSKYSKMSTGDDDEGLYTSSRTSRFSAKKAQYRRSKSLYDDADDDEAYEEYPGVGAGRWAPGGTRIDGAIEDGNDPEEIQVKQYGPSGEINNKYRDSQSRAYGGGVTAGGDFDYTPSYRRASERTNTDYSASSSSYASRLSSYSSAGSPGGYTSKYGGNARQGFMAMRSRTLGNDYSSSYDSPMSPGGSGFSSRFLSKVRENRMATGISEPKSPKAKDKPFKSRFLRKSFDTDYSSSSSRSSYSSRFKSSSIDASSSSTSGIGSSASSSSEGSNKLEANSTDTGGATTEAGSADQTAAE